MSTLLLTFAVSFLVAVVLTPVARSVAQRVGAIDRPDGLRKLQQSPVALGGGIGVYVAFGAALLVAALFREPGQMIPARMTLVLAISAGLLALVGLLDDLLDLRPRHKLALQFVAASPIVLAGFFPVALTIFGYSWAAGWWTAPITLLWLVACANAMNLLDGMDGFTSAAGITLAVGITVIAIAGGNFAVAVAAVALVGALVGFLPFNLPPASIYLGDTGSMLIGLVLGTLSLFAFDIEGKSVPIVVPAAIMAIPMWDVVMAIARRRLKRQPVGMADRNHLHHQLIARGMSNWQALAVLVGLCSTTTAIAAIAMFFRHDLAACLAVSVLFAGLVALRLFGHHERELAIEVAATRIARWALSLLFLKKSAPPSATAGSGIGLMSEEAKRKIGDLATQAGVYSIDIGRSNRPDARQTVWQHEGDAGRHQPVWRFALRPADAEDTSYEICVTVERTALNNSGTLIGAIRLLHEYAVPMAEQMANADPETVLFTTRETRKDGRDAAPSEDRRAA